MDNNFKKNLVNNLSAILPPLVDSITDLLEHVKNNEEIFNDTLLANLGSVTHYVDQTIKQFTREMENIKSGDNSASVHEHELKEITEISNKFEDTFNNINKGVGTLIFLLVKEKNLTDSVKEKEWYISLADKADGASPEVAIDSLYKGAKKLSYLIDLIIE
ncbi:hypothetical protein [Virgibacillus salexigens]|uniref:hypothetical protein n=1 Tax=Virgibacillus salexigens TaxID=61016 RepID=UPI0030814E78